MAERRQTKSKAGGRILIVDDDPIVAESLSEFLGAEGYSTAVCFNASEALLRGVCSRRQRLGGRSRLTSC